MIYFGGLEVETTKHRNKNTNKQVNKQIEALKHEQKKLHNLSRIYHPVQQ